MSHSLSGTSRSSEASRTGGPHFGTDVVIVAHNSGNTLAEAVTSAVAQADGGHVWVMDAQSTDGSVDALRATEPGRHRADTVLIIPVPNRGFAAATNRGIEAGTAPFVLLLNPDAALQPGALEALQRAARENPRAGIVGALVLNADGAMQAGSYGRFPSLANTLRLRLWRSWQWLRANHALSPPAPIATTRVDWVTGAAMLVRREAIAQVGLLDEGFFLYYEDVDWCWRMHAAGWEVLLEPQAKVVHHLGGSSANSTMVARAYRESFHRYCDLRGLWGLKAASRAGLAIRKLVGGRA